MIGQAVELAVQLPLAHPLDPFASGHLVTSGGVGSKPFLTQADDRILLGCDFLWDIVANAEVFRDWCTFTAPDKKLDLKSNFNVAPGFSLTMLPDLPTNRPSIGNSRAMCQHWTMHLHVSGKNVAYQIGSWRPSSNTMEATNVLAA